MAHWGGGGCWASKKQTKKKLMREQASPSARPRVCLSVYLSILPTVTVTVACSQYALAVHQEYRQRKLHFIYL